MENNVMIGKLFFTFWKKSFFYKSFKVTTKYFLIKKATINECIIFYYPKMYYLMDKKKSIRKND